MTGGFIFVARSLQVEALAAGTFLRRSRHYKLIMRRGLLVWGQNATGLLGLGTTTAQLSPTIAVAEGVRNVALGKTHSLIVKEDSSVFAAGKADYNQLGNGSNVQQTTFNKVEGLPEGSVVDVKCGDYHSLVLYDNGDVWSWGWGGNFLPFMRAGAVGHGKRAAQPTPKKIEALSGKNIKQISAGAYHSIAIEEGGNVWVWGDGEAGRLGLSTTGAHLEPVQMPLDPFGGDEIVSVTTAQSHSIAVTASGKLFSWGKNDHSQLGVRSDFAMDHYAIEKTPTVIDALLDNSIVNAACSARHSVVISDEGRLWVWGDSKWFVPTELSDSFLGRKLTQVAAGHNFSLALDEQGVLYSWGRGKSGCLGQGDKKNQPEPAKIEGLQDYNIQRIFASQTSAAAIVQF